MAESYLPAREADLLAFAQNMDNLITAAPATYGLTAPQATAFSILYTNYANALQLATNPPTRTPPAIVAKNDAKAALIDGPGGIRELARIVQATPSVTNQAKADLGLTVRDGEPTPVPVPKGPPDIAIESVLNRTVRIRLRDMDNPDRRGKPDGVRGASVFMWVGSDEPPADPMEWSFFGNTTKTLFDVEFPQTIAAGTKVWLTAFWYNTKAEAGPPATAVSTRFSDGMAQAA